MSSWRFGWAVFGTVVFFGMQWNSGEHTIAQVAADNATLRSIPDALDLDVSAESVLARIDQKADRPLLAESVEELQKLLLKPKIGLIPSQDVQADTDFGARCFANGKLVAAKLLLRALADSEVVPSAQTSRKLYPQAGLLELATQRANSKKIFEAIDSCIELGWTNCARELMYAMEPRLQAQGGDGNRISWTETRSRVQGNDAQAKTVALAKSRLTTESGDTVSSELLVQLWMRLVYCSMIEQDHSRFALEAEIVNAVFGDAVFSPDAGASQVDAPSVGRTVRETIARWSEELDDYRTSLQNANTKRSSLGSYTEKIYEQRFEQRYAPSRSLIPGFPSSPAIMKDTLTSESVVLVRRSNKILRWQSGNVTVWPVEQNKSSGSLDLIDVPELNLADEAKLGAMSGNDSHVFALLDSRQRSSAGSDALRESLLVGFEVRDGLQIITTPITAKNTLATVLKTKPKETSTFLGTPLVTDDQLFVLISDAVSSGTFRVACFQIPSMELNWISDPFGIEKTAEPAVVSNSCLMLHQGRLFVASGQGTIASLRVDDGSVLFQVNYATSKPRPYDRELAPLVRTTMVAVRDVIICTASDAASVFAVDWSDGHLHWSMDRGQFQRAPQIVGLVDDELLCIGDRLAWVNVDTGSPEAVVELTQTAVPMSGQALVIGSDIVWSNGASIFSYPAKRNVTSPRYSIAARKDLQRWHFSSVEPLAFTVDERLMSIATESTWLIFQSK